MSQTSQEEACQPCHTGCSSVFDRVTVQHYVKGNSTIMWELLPSFTDPGPLIFQLPVSSVNHPVGAYWTNVGPAVHNQFTAKDPEQRVWGMLMTVFYRVQLSTPLGTYYSDPVSGMGVLDKRDWLKAREIIRQKQVGYRVGHSAQAGFLLKRRWGGEPCPCRDPLLNQPGRPECSICYGTGWRCGYYYPLSCVWADVKPTSQRVENDNTGVRGTIADVVTSAEMLGTYLMSTNDVWVSTGLDDRYYVQRVSSVVEIRGVPIVSDVELRQIPYSSQIYAIPAPAELNSARR